MQDQDKEKPIREIVENSGNKEADFEADRNLTGAFSILLEWDKRAYPQNYQRK